MSVQSAVANIVNNAFNSLGDLQSEFTLVSDVSTFDPLTSETTTVTSTSVVKGLLDNGKIKYMDEKNLTDEYVTLWVKFNGVHPTLADKVIDGTDEYKILKVEPLKTNDTVFVYRLFLAK